jgi:hypothetical protein
MEWTDIEAEFRYISDARRVIEMSPADAYEEAMRLMARQIVLAVIARRPDETAEDEAGAAVPPAPPQRELGTVGIDTRVLDSGTTETEEPDSDRSRP